MGVVGLVGGHPRPAHAGHRLRRRARRRLSPRQSRRSASVRTRASWDNPPMEPGMDAKLAEIEAAHDHVATEMALPEVAVDRERMRTLGKRFAELEDVVRPYREYRGAAAQAEEARALAKA